MTRDPLPPPASRLYDHAAEQPPAPAKPAARVTPKRTNPAHGARAVALGASVLTTVGLAATFAMEASASHTVQPVASVTPVSTVTTAPSTPPSTETASGLTDGTYTGSEADNRWGTVQVAVTVKGGTITAVDILQQPEGDRKSMAISQRSLPTLVSRTLQAQSADVNSVSGATYTSDSYLESLQSALDQAGLR